LPTQAQRQDVLAARRLYTRALRADAGHMPSLVGLAMLEARSGNSARALRLYGRALDLDPRSVQALHAAAQMHRSLGDLEVNLPSSVPSSTEDPPLH
jgi:pre-mRNA-processing factor 6